MASTSLNSTLTQANAARQQLGAFLERIGRADVPPEYPVHVTAQQILVRLLEIAQSPSVSCSRA